MKKTIIATLGYLLITFPLGYTWHLVLFKEAYEAFGVYTRQQPIIPLGILSMLIQGPILAYGLEQVNLLELINDSSSFRKAHSGQTDW